MSKKHRSKPDWVFVILMFIAAGIVVAAGVLLLDNKRTLDNTAVPSTYAETTISNGESYPTDALRIGDKYYSTADVSYYAYSTYLQYYVYCESTYGDGSYVNAFLDAETLLDLAISTLARKYALYTDLTEKGFAYNISDITGKIEETREEAVSIGKTYEQHLKDRYGRDMTVECFEKNMMVDGAASEYASFLLERQSCSEEELEAYYAEHKKDFSFVDYEQLFFYVSSAYPDEKAELDAESAYQELNQGKSFSALSEELPQASYSLNTNVQYNASAIFDWLFDGSRMEGDTALIRASGTAYYVLRFDRLYREEYNTVRFRHILFAFGDGVSTENSALSEAEKDQMKSNTEEKARLYASAWLNGEQTEASFSQLAADVAGSDARGDLYTEVYRGRMIEPIDDWLFAAGRKENELGIVESDHGYHLLLFGGEDRPYWQVRVDAAIRQERYSSYLSGLLTEEVERLNGILSVKKYIE